MISFEFGQVVLIHFPQTAAGTKKQRPGIVLLDIGDADLVIAPVTSKTRSAPGDLPLTDLANSGLVLPSWVRLAKVATLLKTDVVRTLGRMASGDRSEIARNWLRLYGSFAS
jgi:mRNA interferase MazF